MFLISLPGVAQAAEPLVAREISESLAGHLDAFYDPSGALSLADVAFSDAADNFTPVARYYSNGFGKPGAAWVRLALAAPSGGATDRILKLNPVGLDNVDVYVAKTPYPDGPDDFEHFVMGASRPYAERPLPYPSVLVPLELSVAPRPVFVRITSRTSLSLHGSLETRQSLLQMALTDWLFIGGYLSACIFVAGTNFAFWFWLRERYYLFYAMFALSMPVRALWRTGLLFVVMPGIAHAIHLSFLGMITGIAMTCAFLFAATFLPFKQWSPVAHRMVLMLAAAGPVYMLAALAGYWDRFFFPISLICLALAVWPLWQVIRMATSGVRRAQLYLLSFTPANLGVVAIIARNAGWLPTSGLIDYAYQFGVVVHLIIMTIGLASRIERSERERRTAKHSALVAAQRAEHRASEIAAQRTRELSRAKAELEEALAAEQRHSREQLQFIDMISHEYRTPVAVMRTNLDLLRIAQGKGDTVPAPPLKRIGSAIARLTEIIEVSLKEDRISSRGLAPTTVAVAPQALVEDAIRIASNVYPDRQIAYLESDPEDLMVIQADVALLKTALVNLIENGLKYSPNDAPVEVCIGRRGSSDAVTISVTDHGPGIAEKDMPFIFEKYYRASSAAKRPGAGIGLYLVRNIVMAHDGHVSLESSKEGTVASIELPLDGHSEQGAP